MTECTVIISLVILYQPFIEVVIHPNQVPSGRLGEGPTLPALGEGRIGLHLLRRPGPLLGVDAVFKPTRPQSPFLVGRDGGGGRPSLCPQRREEQSAAEEAETRAWRKAEVTDKHHPCERKLLWAEALETVGTRWRGEARGTERLCPSVSRHPRVQQGSTWKTPRVPRWAQDVGDGAARWQERSSGTSAFAWQARCLPGGRSHIFPGASVRGMPCVCGAGKHGW